MSSTTSVNKIKFSNFKKETWASVIFMGLGQLMFKQFGRAIIYMLIEIGALAYFITRGFEDIIGFFTLGTEVANPWTGQSGDNSVMMLLMGVFAFIALSLFIILYVRNIRDAYETQLIVESGGQPATFKEDLASMLDENFHKTALFFPLLGVFVFNILPIIFMILIAFTNYGGEIQPPRLVDWVGLDNFQKILTLEQFAPTFFKILVWNITWAILSTVINFAVGIFVAVHFSSKNLKGKGIWRGFPILAMATPGFITLIAFKFMFSYGGPINQILVSNGFEAIGFLDVDAAWTARWIGILVNAWISSPSIVLIVTAMMSNIDHNIYEAADIDGAGKFRQFFSITLPHIIHTTTPILIGTFIGTFNNFGIFYFLRGGLYTEGYFLASDTDLLINWLYNLSINNDYYSIGAAISIIIFIFTATFSLIVYVKSPAYREEGKYL